MDEATRQEAKKILVERWESTKLLTGIKGDFEKEQMAILLQNQLEDNERNGQSRNECNDPSVRGQYSQFMRISIPIVRRVFNSNSLLAYKIASVQAIQMVEDNYFFRDNYGILKPRSIGARGRTLKERVKVEPKSDLSHFDLNEEAEMTAQMAERISEEINWEVARDIKTNAGVKNVHAWKEADILKACIGLVSSQIYRKTHKDTNWIVTSEQMASELFGEEKKAESSKPIYAGLLSERYHVYIYPRMEAHELLIGHKGDGYTAGYFYCPMTPIFFMPGNEPIGEGHEYPYMTRYGKAMPFPDFYGHITVTG